MYHERILMTFSVLNYCVSLFLLYSSAVLSIAICSHLNEFFHFQFGEKNLSCENKKETF